jgi:hypothetical protein
VTPPVRQDRRPFVSVESCTSHHGEGRRPSAWGEKPGQSKDQSAAVNIYATPSSTPSRPRLHRRPDVSAPQPSSSSLPLGCFPVLDWRRRGASPGNLTCLCAGHRAAEMPPRDVLELLGSSCSRAHRRRAMCLCECRPLSRECICRERGAPHPWLPGGCAGRTW